MKTIKLNIENITGHDTVDVPQRNHDRSDISIGRALDRLISVAQISKGELKGDIDGIDALCYHLNSHICQDAIVALQKVLMRFEAEYEGTKTQNFSLDTSKMM